MSKTKQKTRVIKRERVRERAKVNKTKYKKKQQKTPK